MKDKILGMLLGLHCGDSLGATNEFCEPSEFKNEHKDIVGEGYIGWRPGQATDDTDLMICLLKSLVKNKGFVIEDVAKNYIEWMESDPKDIGGTTSRSIARLKQGIYIPSEPAHERSQANGSLMRCAPLAAFYEGSNLMRNGNEQCSMTHHHMTCTLCDEVYLMTLRYLLKGFNITDSLNLIEITADALDKPEMKLENIKKLPWEELKTSGYVVDTLIAGVWGLLNTDNFEDAVVWPVNRGDDSDTIGAVAGALAGAYYGVDAIPSRWLDKIERKNEIIELVEQIPNI